MIVKEFSDHKFIGWRAWYENNQIFDSITTQWKDLPNDGLLAVVIYQKFVRPNGERTRRTWSGVDYYWTTPESGLEVFCGDEEPSARYPGAIVKRGKWVPILEMERVNQEAREAKDF